MVDRNDFDIAFSVLRAGTFTFDYEIDDGFFNIYGVQDFEHCNSTVKVELMRDQSFLRLKFFVYGAADVVCDRCGNTINKVLWEEFNLIVKMVDNPDYMNETEEDPEIAYIGKHETSINVADWIFEFINLSLPMVKYCSDEQKQNGACNYEVLKKLEEMELRVLNGNGSVNTELLNLSHN